MIERGVILVQAQYLPRFIHTYIHTYIYTDRQKDRQTDKKTDRQTGIYLTTRHVKMRYISIFTDMLKFICSDI